MAFAGAEIRTGRRGTPMGLRSRMCLASQLGERTERGVYAASVSHRRSDVADSPQRRESDDGEAA